MDVLYHKDINQQASRSYSDVTGKQALRIRNTRSHEKNFPLRVCHFNSIDLEYRDVSIPVYPYSVLHE